MLVLLLKDGGPHLVGVRDHGHVDVVGALHLSTTTRRTSVSHEMLGLQDSSWSGGSRLHMKAQAGHVRTERWFSETLAQAV